jgi:hypothetical protein
MLFIGKEGEGRGARPGNDGGVEKQYTGGSGRRWWMRGGTGMDGESRG